MKRKTKERRQVITTILNLTKKKQKIVFVSGNFNVLHPGHLRLLRFAAECGDFLVVGVNSDQTSKAIVPEELRLESLQATNWVDYAFILREKPEDFLKFLRPAIVVKGSEHESRVNPEGQVLNTYGGTLLFSSGDLFFSSIDLLRNEFKNFNPLTIIKSHDYLARHNCNISELKGILQKIKGLKVIVVGDTIVDKYITCDPIGMSQEDPTLVVSPILNEKFVGGAGIVACHARGLGADVRYFSVVGNDETADFVNGQLEQNQVTPFLVKDASRPTTTKERYRAQGKTLLRVNHLRQHYITKKNQQKLFNGIKKNIYKADLLIFSDFNYGCLPQKLVEKIIRLCKKNKVRNVADSQSSSQFGDVARFKGMSLLTPTEREARLAVRDTNSGLVVVAEKLKKRAGASNIVMTLGEEGILIHSKITKKSRWLTDRLPAMNKAPRDVAGAGDSLLTCTALSMTAGANIWQSAYLGSLAAACQVKRVGNIPLNVQDLTAELRA